LKDTSRIVATDIENTIKAAESGSGNVYSSSEGSLPDTVMSETGYEEITNHQIEDNKTSEAATPVRFVTESYWCVKKVICVPVHAVLALA
uniref:Transferrin receptor n=1 Tax=Gongylonema pulchrum TaxID=637853 RepID=A0A183EL41_9BILA